MRINLIFTPYVASSCVPIGIASLKSYLEENMNGVKVKTIDLNLDFVNKLVEGKVSRRNTIKEKYQDELLFKTAKHIIKSNKLFYDKNLIVRYVLPFYASVAEYVTFLCYSVLIKYLERKITDDDLILGLFKDEIEKAVEGKPTLIGFSVLAEAQIYFSLAMGKLIKKKYNLPIVFGGPALFNHDLKGLMDAFEFIDFIVVKEGEQALQELIKKISKGESYENVPNLIWRKNGEIIFNKEKMINNLDELPTPDYSDLKLNDYYFPEVILPISSARNCPWKMCKFCELNSQYGPKYRQRSIEKVVDDIRMLKERYNVNNFFFTDSEITAVRLREISQAISKANLQVYFGCYARPTKSLSFEVLKTAYEGGFRFLMLGVESLSNRLLKFVKKGTTYESILNTLKNASKLKIKLLCYMLCGLPTQTREELLSDMKEIANLQRKYDIFSISFCLYKLGKYQAFYQEREKYGIEIIGKRRVFSTTTSKKVYLEGWLRYRYKDKGEYDILIEHDRPEINSIRETGSAYAKKKLRELETQFGINGNSRNRLFLYTINNFLFEAQLLYFKGLGRC